MADRPILFSGPMVRALLAGQKTQTRRLLAPFEVPRFVAGDRLWVREDWRAGVGYDGARARDIAPVSRIWFPADKTVDPRAGKTARHSIYMPRWASRLTLTVTEVRVQRLQEISEEDARAEGMHSWQHDELGTLWSHSVPGQRVRSTTVVSPAGWERPTSAFLNLWDSLHGRDAWDANPWVVALTFTTERRNIDAQ